MVEIFSIKDLPGTPAVYAMYGGVGTGLYIAYVGIADDLRRRINQHLILRNSSIATGVSTVHLNPNQVTEIRWWQHEKLTDKAGREAAEIIAFDILNPVLRSRGKKNKSALLLCEDKEFYEEIKKVFTQLPNGRLMILTLERALERIEKLEKRISKIEQELLHGVDKK